MLKYLHIENIAVIEKSDIEFNEGFNVLTGETGAGKSIVIDSLNAVLGERTSKELIRNGCESAEVSALFTDISDFAAHKLAENGFSCDNSELLIKRTLSLSGSGSVRINGKLASVGILKEISRNLVDIHGQHDNRNLLDEKQHLGYIDKLAGNSAALQEYYSEFRNLNSIRKELASLETDEDEKQRKTELLQFQIAELQDAGLKVGEFESLKKQLTVAENFEKTAVSLNRVLNALKGNDDNDGVTSVLKSAENELSGLNMNCFEESVNKISSSAYELESVCENIHSYLNNSDYNAENTEEIRERLDFLYRIMLKYGDSEEKALSYLENAVKELETITFSEKRIEELSEKLDESTERLVSLADKLTETRKRAAQIFEQKVCEGLELLNMHGVKFTVNFKKGRYSKTGCDEVSFLISANAGEEPRAMAKIASGGELSRIMLVIKQVLADKDEVETLVFDEIDTGISGHAAVKVGKMLQNVADSRQVICVTHLAQIAAAADSHLLIEKHSKDGRTFTDVSTLEKEQRINEIARIMSGGDLSENIINSAKELLDRSKTNGNL